MGLVSGSKKFSIRSASLVTLLSMRASSRGISAFESAAKCSLKLRGASVSSGKKIGLEGVVVLNRVVHKVEKTQNQLYAFIIEA